MPSKTLFSKIIDREIPASIVYEDDVCVAFNDINAQAPVHILLVPRKEITKLSTADRNDQSILGHMLTVAPAIAKEAGLEDFRLVINNGESAGQSVFHLHMHILGGRTLQWPPG